MKNKSTISQKDDMKKRKEKKNQENKIWVKENLARLRVLKEKQNEKYKIIRSWHNCLLYDRQNLKAVSH